MKCSTLAVTLLSLATVISLSSDVQAGGGRGGGRGGGGMGGGRGGGGMGGGGMGGGMRGGGGMGGGGMGGGGMRGGGGMGGGGMQGNPGMANPNNPNVVPPGYVAPATTTTTTAAPLVIPSTPGQTNFHDLQAGDFFFFKTDTNRTYKWTKIGDTTAKNTVNEKQATIPPLVPVDLAEKE